MTTITLPDPFQAAELTNTLELMPIQYGELGRMNLFPFIGMATTIAAIRRTEMGLCLVPAADRCGPPRAANKGPKRDMVFIEVPHIPIEDAVIPCDVQNRTKLDLSDPAGLMNFADEVNLRMRQMRDKLDITGEYHMVRALFGEVLDADGEVMLDLYETFGQAATNLPWNFANPNFDVQKACLQLQRLMRKKFKGLYQRVKVMCDPCFFEKLVTHPTVRDAYKRCCDTMLQNVAGDPRQGFTYGGVTFWEYDAEACAIVVAANGVVTEEMRQFMAPPLDANGDPIGSCIAVAYPEGAPNTYEMLGAPPTDMNYVNTKATSPYFASMWPRCHNEGYDLKSQRNAIPIMKQPQALIRLVGEPA